jgi:CBS domain-containing protein
MSDQIDEEFQVAKEQDSGGTALSSDTFTEPIKNVRMPKVLCVDVSTKVGEAVQCMQKNKIGSVVVTKNGKLEGIITERDILMKVIGLIDDWKNTSVSEIMTPNPQCLMPQDEIAYVLNNMHVGGYRHVPIVNEDDVPISMISIKDVVSWLLDHFPMEIINLTGEPYRGPVSREGA